MAINDANIVAATGEILVEGDFAVSGEGAATFRRARHPVVGLRLREGRHGTQFSLYDAPVRGSDGLWSVGRALHSVSFEPALAPLSALLDYPAFSSHNPDLTKRDTTRIESRVTHGSLAWVMVDAADDFNSSRPPLLGHADAVGIDTHRDADAFTIRLACDVPVPRRGETIAPPLRVSVDARLPYAALALAGKYFGTSLGKAAQWSGPPSDQTGPLTPRLVTDWARGTPIFRGRLDFGGGSSRQTYVFAALSEHGLRLGVFDGAAIVRSPELHLYNLGPSLWERMLNNRDEAALELTGAGIGYVDAVTGRDAGEIGPHRQDVTALEVHLKRSEAGLHIAIKGTLGPLRQEAVQPALGPDFSAELTMPATFLFVRGIRLGSQLAERRRMIGES